MLRTWRIRPKKDPDVEMPPMELPPSVMDSPLSDVVFLEERGFDCVSIFRDVNKATSLFELDSNTPPQTST